MTMGILSWIVLGAIAGWVANKIAGGGEGIVMTIVVGIVLFILFTPESFGAASSLDLGAPASVTTTSKAFQGPERPTLETMGKETINLNLDKKRAPRMPPQVSEITGIGGHHSENVIRTDETSVRLLAPWQ